MTGLVCEYDFEPHQGPCRMWAGKPAATSGNVPVQVFESAKMGTENRVVPALRKQPGTVAEDTGGPRHA